MEIVEARWEVALVQTPKLICGLLGREAYTLITVMDLSLLPSTCRINYKNVTEGHICSTKMKGNNLLRNLRFGDR